MTNQIQDMKMSDAFMVCGSNAAENHPITFKWIEQALHREKDPATLIVVDPRFTRTASKANIYAQTRPGTDIVFFGALITYAIKNLSLIHISEPTRRTPISYAVFCLKKKK